MTTSIASAREAGFACNPHDPRSWPPGWCGRCSRPIEIDNLRGRPADHSQYCLGVDTCIQQQKGTR